MKFSFRAATAAVVASMAFAASAHAQITFTGFTNGCFYTVVSCTPGSTNVNATDQLAGSPLLYRNSTFSGTTSLGFLGIGNAPGSGVNVDNLGSFMLTGGLHSFVGENFNMRVSFTAPTGTVPSNTVYTANLTGNVSVGSGDNGGVSVNFTNATQSFLFDGGSFTLKMNDLSLQGVGSDSPNKLVAVTGQILATTVPEPSTYLLMAAGLAGLGVVARRRRSV